MLMIPRQAVVALASIAAAALLAVPQTGTAHAWMYDVRDCHMDKDRRQIEKRGSGLLYCVSNDTYYELVERGWGRITFPGYQVIFHYTMVTPDRTVSLPRTSSISHLPEDWSTSEFVEACRSGGLYHDPNIPPYYVEGCILKWYNDTAKQLIGPVS